MNGGQSRESRPEVVRRLEEARAENKAAQLLQGFEGYVNYTIEKREPEALSNRELLSYYEGFTHDYIRYSGGGDLNFPIVALACEWLKDVAREVLRRMEPSRWGSPLHTPLKDIPQYGHPGAFGMVRKHDVHTGVDLYTEEGSPVYAVEAGEVVAVLPFTGPEAESPWWFPTDAVMVEGASGVVLYGEIGPKVKVGEEIFPGTLLGHVKRVLRNDKGKPMSMLHLELYVPGTKDAVWWTPDQPKPTQLLDPTPFLLKVGKI